MAGGSPIRSSTPTGAVFLSYASEDAASAEQIATALRAAGIEIWFDKSELRGGDVWDRMIRQRIRDCALFIPVISQHTQERLEGYFRLEWRLAVDRSQRMAAERTFIVPVVVDATREREALVPEYFHELQLTHLPDGEIPSAFVERIKMLLGQTLSPAEAAATATPPGPPTGQPPEAPLLTSARRASSAVWAVGALLALVIAYFVVDKFWLSKRPAASPTVSATVDSGQTSAGIPEKSIAVLPFVDMSEKHDQGYFSDGLSEELIDMLTKVPDLRVPARTSSFYFKGKSEDIATIAQRLHVANVLEGSVRKAGNALRVTAQLIRADNGYHLWSETYDRELKDVFKVQDDIADAVVTALKAHLLPTRSAAQAEVRTASIASYDQYLQGRQSFNRGDTEGYQDAVTAFSAATSLDPHYAPAYAALALAQFWLADTETDDRGFERALAAANKAVALAPGLGSGYAARGFVRAIQSFDFAGGKADLDQAVALSPRDADVLHRSAVVLAILGNLPAAIARERQALALDPLSAEICMRLAFFLVADQQFPEARQLYEQALAIAPSSIRAHFNLGQLDLLENRPEQALTAFRQTEHVGFSLMGEAMAEYSLGHLDASQRDLDRLIALNDTWAVAQVYAWRGENDRALDWLERAYSQHDPGLTWIKTYPTFRALRGEARYTALLRRMKLPE